MRKPVKAIAVFLGASIFFFARSAPVSAGDGRINLNFKEKTISANIREASLRSVVANVREKRGVWFKLWFKGRESLLDEKISLQFENLPVQEGLERIFSKMNHSLIFDHDGRLVGVFLLVKPSRITIRSRSRTVPPRRTPRRYRRR